MLFTCRPLTGHFAPLLPLAHTARAAGHSVAFASGPPVVEQAKAAGFAAFEAGRPAGYRNEWAPLFPGFTQLIGDEQRTFFFTEIFANLELVPRADDLESIVAAWQPNLIVHEMAELAAPLIGTLAGLPYVDVGYGALIPHAVLAAAGSASARHWRDRGLEPHPLAGLFRDLYIDPCPPALQSDEIGQLRAVQRLRPASVEVEAADPPVWLTALPDRPTVYVTLGTVWNTDLDVFRLLINALRSDDLNLIVTVGRGNDPKDLGRQPDNVIICDFVPQHQILAHCDVVVAHGGSGTVLGALAFGVPLLVVPQGADQWSNAERVVAAGAGLQLVGGEVSSAALRGAVAALMTDPSYRAAAEAIGVEIRSMPPAASALGGLESLL